MKPPISYYNGKQRMASKIVPLISGKFDCFTGDPPIQQALF